MGPIIQWLPLIWAARVAAFAILVAVAWVLLLYLARYARPKHVVSLLGADLPDFSQADVSLKVLGIEVAANSQLDLERDKKLEALSSGLLALDYRVQRLEDHRGDNPEPWRGE